MGEINIGIYKITSPSGKIYIGQSVDIKRRKNQYKNLNGNIKSQTILYRSLLKYGFDAHKFEIIEECSEDKLLERETHWKNHYKVLDTPSLCCRIDGKGGRDSQETKNNKSKASKGKIKSEEHKNSMSIAKIGHSMYNDQWRANMSKSQKGKINTWGDKISEAKKGTMNSKIKCPFCDKIGGEIVMVRWHFNKCKNKTT